MTENTRDLAQTFEIYCDCHPEKFENAHSAFRRRFIWQELRCVYC